MEWGNESTATVGKEKISGVHINKFAASYSYCKLIDKTSTNLEKILSISYEIYSWTHLKQEKAIRMINVQTARR